jgi:predicted unusual protein kinase regulating ubiquinone biosynthesis (AarF/ABC1/UbiB family)
LIDQVYFTRESKNLKKYNKIFINPDVKFPLPFPETNDEVLVETFAEGLPITFYSEHPHKLNKAIAMLGASTFF